jgi:hypothetical protein
MNKFYAVLALALVVLVAGCVQNGATGATVVGITDPAAWMGSVTSVNITIDSVSAHNDSGWQTISSTQKTYDLLQLSSSGSTMVLADYQLPEGDYQQLRLQISKVEVTDANGTHEAKLPSGELKINGDLTVKPNTTAVVVFDFAANESLHMTGNGEYIMMPVVSMNTYENASVDRSNGKLNIKSGRIKASVKVGMDINGTVGTDRILPQQANLSIENGRIKAAARSGRP